jgi:hypothetical protein
MTENFKSGPEQQGHDGKPVNEPGVFRAGTLVYTKMSLAVLFFWLLWGDFCYVLMESGRP